MVQRDLPDRVFLTVNLSGCVFYLRIGGWCVYFLFPPNLRIDPSIYSFTLDILA